MTIDTIGQFFYDVEYDIKIRTQNDLIVSGEISHASILFMVMITSKTQVLIQLISVDFN